MDRRNFLKSSATLGLALASPPIIGHAATKELLVAEPVHSTGYLPMYIAMAKGFFAESDINVKIVTIETGGGHTNAVLSGQAFAFIGGPEHNAFAKAKGADLRAVVNCVDRGNVYFCAAKGQEPKDKDWPAYFRGKSIALSPSSLRAAGSAPASSSTFTAAGEPYLAAIIRGVVLFGDSASMKACSSSRISMISTWPAVAA